ncbi:TPA: hypothetical protein I7142_18245 [Vibrio vulnificus]|uniref:hypothetical protein n=1 Tax=Vibrio TaxID=662 RepID=UPI0012687D3D|nr:hypothetical protein [Vibrio parahaemolyticus]EGQ9239473.1 hypothetical protein [Vibrio vulnificus]EKZ9225844.1 hypothetical protein [Vibrio vulnificus]MCU8149777.1 hypothetical protein [Vibrio vulnificus]MCU8385834.1 hypothetical protein [Vibrio vulnificus]HAS6026409.1 hypothetical protein [Vibrio vulnificus]
MADLIEIGEFIALQKEIVRNNLNIAFRIVGGISSFSSATDVDPVQVSEFFKLHQYDQLSNLFSSHFGFDLSWFDVGRCYYPDNQIAVFRMKNLNCLMTYVSNTPEFLNHLASKLTPRQHELTSVLDGRKSHWSSHVCRVIEHSSRMQRGSLDLHPDRFVILCAEHFCGNIEGL